MKADLRETPLSIDETIAAVRRPGAGGLAVFVGVVRDESEGRPVTRLEYSAYASMARREMESIVAEIEHEIDGVRAAAVHRIGSLDVGEAAVVCAASAPHRGEAFRACRELIDRIKQCDGGGMSGQHTVPHRVRAIAVTGRRLIRRIVLVVPLLLMAGFAALANPIFWNSRSTGRRADTI